MFKGQPKGLFPLALANTGERFGYYTMIAVFALFLKANFGLSAGTAGLIYSTFLGLVYFLPLVGGILADKFGFGKMVVIGISVMFFGYLFLSLPLGGDTVALLFMMLALLLISFGTGLFKGNLQVMVGNLYDDPKYADKRDSGFSLFYMAINIGALFAPTAAIKMKEWGMSMGWSENTSYHLSFAVACASLIVSIIIYYAFRKLYRDVEGEKKGAKAAEKVQELSPEDTKKRIVALCLVFLVVIFFWMAFHQNGLSLTYFADEFTERSISGIPSMAFDVINLAMVIVIVYALFSLFDKETQKKGKVISGLAIAAALGVLYYKSTIVTGSVHVSAPIFQQFNPFYVVALTPVSLAIFGGLAKKGKEPSAPRKIAYGMLVAACAFGIMAFASLGLNSPNKQKELDQAVKAKTELLAAEKKAAEKAQPVVMEDYKEETMTIEEIDGEFYVTEETPAEEPAAVDVAVTEEALDEAPAEIIDRDAIIAAGDAAEKDLTFASPFVLVLIYLILTFGELLLSPMGISFVSKVAPPKYKGMMMGGWFVATAIGNLLVSVGGFLWGGLPLWSVWCVFLTLCLLSAAFMFIMMKKLEDATK